MTKPIHDGVVLAGERCALVWMEGRPQFHPRCFGVEPSLGGSTADARGFDLVYEVAETLLHIATLRINCPPSTRLQGRRASAETPDGPVWAGVAIPWPFTGVMIACGDRDHGLSCAYAYPWRLAAYRRVTELHFEDGRQIREADRSGALDELRRKGKALPLVDLDESAAFQDLLGQLDPEAAEFARLLRRLERVDTARGL
jgi:hypothetical protein